MSSPKAAHKKETKKNGIRFAWNTNQRFFYSVIAL